MKELGSAIARERKRKGMKQKELAALVGISANAMCSIEKGNSIPSPKVYDKIFKCLNVRPVVRLVDMKIDLSSSISAVEKYCEALKQITDENNN